MATDSNKISIPTEQEVKRFSGAPDAPMETGAPMESLSLEDRLASAEKDRDEYKDKMLRAQAECANITKRLTQERGEALKLAGMGLARAVLAVLDNFERTLANLRDTHAADPVIAGVKLIADQLSKVLKDHGVEPIESVGKPFDPVLHEALLHDRESSERPGTVTQEFERGYTMHGRVLRHAKVAVAAPETTHSNGDGAAD